MFLISSYGTPLSQRASYLALHSSLFGPDGAVNYKYMYMYDYIVTNRINSLLIVSRRIPNGAHTNHYEPIWPILQNLSKTLVWCVSTNCRHTHLCSTVGLIVYNIIHVANEFIISSLTQLERTSASMHFASTHELKILNQYKLIYHQQYLMTNYLMHHHYDLYR